MQLQPIFIKNIHAAYGEAGKTWLKNLPKHLEDLSKQWNFEFIEQIPDLSFSFVGRIRLNANNELAILKTTPAGEQIISEMHCLRCFKKAVPKIYAANEKKHAFIMEYIQPGYSLKKLIQADEDETATRIICQIIRELQPTQPQEFAFKHISELAKDLSFLKGHVANMLISKAESLFRDLSSDRTQDVLLHGDLHHDNIIKHDSSWKVIDPHGYMGDRAAEAGVMIRNPLDCFPHNKPLRKIIQNRLKILFEELPFDQERIKAWAFCMTVLSAAWNIQDFGHLAKFEIEVASVIT